MSLKDQWINNINLITELISEHYFMRTIAVTTKFTSIKIVCICYLELIIYLDWNKAPTDLAFLYDAPTQKRLLKFKFAFRSKSIFCPGVKLKSVEGMKSTFGDKLNA